VFHRLGYKKYSVTASKITQLQKYKLIIFSASQIMQVIRTITDNINKHHDIKVEAGHPIDSTDPYMAGSLVYKTSSQT
jgi:hypothetical protein